MSEEKGSGRWGRVNLLSRCEYTDPELKNERMERVGEKVGK